MLTIIAVASSTSAFTPTPPRLTATCSYASGCTVTVDGTLFSNATLTATRSNNVTCTSTDGSLTPASASPTPIKGTDKLGSYSGAELHWTCASTPFVTSVRVYRTALGEAAIFAQRWPAGAVGTAVGAANPKAVAAGNAQERVFSTFPSIAPAANNDDTDATSYFVYHNQMLGGMHDGTQYGAWSAGAKAAALLPPNPTMGGPLVVFRPQSFALVIAPVTNAMAMNLAWDDAARSIGCGVLGSVTSIPVGYAAETMLFLGSDTRDACAPFATRGVNCAMRGFGESLLKYKGAKDPNSPAILHNVHDADGGIPTTTAPLDQTANWLGYYTDNGAFYYYYPTPDYGTVLRGVYDTDVTERGVPFKYVQLDSFWYYKGTHGGVLNWTATPAAFPRGLASLHNYTQWPVVAHNRYWGSDTVYATANGGEYPFVVETAQGKALPLSEAFWVDLLRNASDEWGLAVYEQDWLHNEWEGLVATLSSATLAEQWLGQMNAAALKVGVAIQYCMAYGRHALASASFAAVTQVRASDDYATGVRTGDANDDNLYIGTSSMLASALGLAPSKDVWWSNSSARYTEKTPTPRYPSAFEPYPEVQGAVAALSAGPVAPGDEIGAANKSLIMRTCRVDGLLLPPSLPAMPVEVIFARRARGEDSFAGELNAAYSVLPAKRSCGGAVAAGRSGFGAKGSSVYAAIIGINLPSDVTLTAAELGFGGDTKQQLLVWHLRDGVTRASIVSNVTMRACAKVDFGLAYVTAVRASGEPLLLGETAKFVPTSPARFRSWDSKTGIATLVGVPKEIVAVSFWTQGHVVVAKCTFGVQGTATATVNAAAGTAACSAK